MLGPGECHAAAAVSCGCVLGHLPAARGPRDGGGLEVYQPHIHKHDPLAPPAMWLWHVHGVMHAGRRPPCAPAMRECWARYHAACLELHVVACSSAQTCYLKLQLHAAAACALHVELSGIWAANSRRFGVVVGVM
jgi:hypothetical protein